MLAIPLSFPSTLSFAILLLTSFSCLAQTATPASAAKPVSGLTGTIVLSGASGGPVKMGVPDSIPLAQITFVVQREGEAVATFTTDSHGQFQVPLPAGHYAIVRKDWKSRVGFFGPFAADVREGALTVVRWNCETGMQ